MTQSKKSIRRAKSVAHGRNHLYTSSQPTSSFNTDVGLSSVGTSNGTKDPLSSRPSHFSLNDEARHTGRHHSNARSELKLRHTKVSFVSGGDLHAKEPSSEDEIQAGPSATPMPILNPLAQSESAFASLSLDDGANAEHNAAARRIEPMKGPSYFVDDHVHGLSQSTATEDIFTVDTYGSEPPDTGLPLPMVRAISPASSDSSAEVIVFAGRNVGRSNLTNGISERTSPIRPPTTRTRPGPGQAQGHLRVDSQMNERISLGVSMYPLDIRTRECLDSQMWNVDSQHNQRNSLLSSDSENIRSKQDHPFDPSPCQGLSAPAPPFHKGHRKRRRRNADSESDRDEDAVFADYIANMQSNDALEGVELHEPREDASSPRGSFQGFEDPIVEADSSTKLAGLHDKSLAWESSEICDFDGLSTSDDVLGTIQYILSKRERLTGTQYLVVWKDYTIDDARWIPRSSLTMDGAVDKILDFENRWKIAKTSISRDEVDWSTGQDHIDTSTDQDFEEHTDEMIARLLWKQEEMGMGSNDMMLFDKSGALAYEDSNEKDLTVERESDMRVLSRTSYSRGKGGRRSTDLFPSATLLADALDQDPYLGFDVMDHDRPSLKRSKRLRRDTLPLELSDSDLEISLQSVWDNDRKAKKAKKREREERRAQGLLGSKIRGKRDLRAAYTEGLTMDDVISEIQSFLISQHQSIPLPPMDNTDRKTVHEIANLFMLKSKSVGKGKARFPVLYKTSRSEMIRGDAKEIIEARLKRRRFLPRLDKRAKKSSSMPRRAGGGANSAGVSYMDGDVVGAAAPELGIENKGRVMLEKMGWSTGTALGASNNKGILQPVTHVVKTTKAGLG